MRAHGRKTALMVGALAVVVAVGAVLAAQHEWPFSKRSGARARAGLQSLRTPSGEPIRPATEVWSGEVSLLLNQHYALNKKPVEPLESCGVCLTLENHPGGRLQLRVVNGVLAWPKPGRPSYLDCVRLRESGTLDTVPLETSPHDGGLPIHSWMCATSGIDDDILRLQYEGPGQGSKGYRFAVSAWLRPFISSN